MVSTEETVLEIFSHPIQSSRRACTPPACPSGRCWWSWRWWWTPRWWASWCTWSPCLDHCHTHTPIPLYHPPSLVTNTLHYYLTLIYQESTHCVAWQCACADSLQTLDSFTLSSLWWLHVWRKILHSVTQIFVFTNVAPFCNLELARFSAFNWKSEM